MEQIKKSENENLRVEIEKLKKEILDNINTYNQKKAQMSDSDSIEEMIQSIVQSKIKVKTINSLADALLEVDLNSENTYTNKLISSYEQIRVIIVKLLNKLGEIEEEKSLTRANYNYISNKTLFSGLSLCLYGNEEERVNVEENSKIVKFNTAMLLINYYFEKIRDLLMYAMEQEDDKIELTMDKIIKMYNENPQIIKLMREVLISNYFHIPNEKRNKSKIIGNYLINRGTIGRGNDIANTSDFIFLRNASSHGEYYPDIENNVIKSRNTKHNGNTIIDRNFTFDEVINFAKEISSKFLDGEVKIYYDLLTSRNVSDAFSTLKWQYAEEEILTKIGIMLMFNLVQYNNEQYFKKLKEDVFTCSILDEIRLKIDTLFVGNYDLSSKDVYENLEVIKNAIGHFNISVKKGNVVFNNKQGNEIISMSLKKLYEFIIQSNIFDLSLSTFFYTKVETIAKQLFDSEINKKFYYDKRIISDSDLYYNNYNNYDFDDNLIYKDYPKK